MIVKRLEQCMTGENIIALSDETTVFSKIIGK